jgi:hypothetical protein
MNWGARYARAMKDPAYRAAKARFAGFDRSENFFMLVAIPGLTLLSYVALTRLAHARYAALAPAEYILAPDDPSWILPAVLVGLLLSASVGEVRRRLVLGSDAADREALDLRLVSEDRGRARRRAMACSALFLVGIPLYIFLWLNQYAVFRADSIVIRPFGFLHEVQRPYDDVRAISLVEFTQGRFRPVPHPHVLVGFTDGSSWSSASIEHRDNRRDTSLADFLAERTSLVVRRIHGVDPPSQSVAR